MPRRLAAVAGDEVDEVDEVDEREDDVADDHVAAGLADVTLRHGAAVADPDRHRPGVPARPAPSAEPEDRDQLGGQPQPRGAGVDPGRSRLCGGCRPRYVGELEEVTFSEVDVDRLFTTC